MEGMRPLADRMRPRNLDEFIGQGHIVGPDKPLRKAIEADRLHSMIFWGPPGTGKTTLASLIARHSGAQFISLSAVLSGVKEIRSAVEQARQAQQMEGRATILFIDEVHRFNKAQQDAFLPHVENGTVVFVGATTENPSFELNNALLSRARTYVLKSLTGEDLEAILEQALEDGERGLGERGISMDPELKTLLAEAADGDARRALNLLEISADLSDGEEITRQAVEEVITGNLRRFDKGGEAFY
ncbi:MAG: AAA family ATPase, partial [Sedimenticola sp.]